MKVHVLASTVLRPGPLADEYGYEAFTATTDGPITSADALAEAAGRICYKSFRRPNPATAQNADYLANILAKQHFSVLEHSSVTLLVRGVSRALLTELERHRHLSFSVVSQRYVNYSQTEPVIPPAATPVVEAVIRDAYDRALVDYEKLVMRLEAAGLARKKAREAARAVLPNAAPVDMLVTGNLRAWRDVLGKRWHIAADAEIQEFAGQVLTHLRVIAPSSVQDIPLKPYGSSDGA